MNKLLIGLLVIACVLSCKNKKLDSTKAYFSVVDYLKAEVKGMDSLNLKFTKITTVDSTADTASITKEQFREYAAQFLNIPDIATSKKMDDYTETNDFDEILNNVLLIYTPKNEEDAIRNETIMMQPDEQGNTHVKTILVTTIKSDKNTSVVKNMTWHIGKRFQIVTKENTANQPEKINTVVVSWE